MKDMICFFKALFRVQYRLSVLYHGETEPRHTYGTDGRILRHMARNTEDISDYWTLYKKGPFGMPEHEVDSYMRIEN